MGRKKTLPEVQNLLLSTDMKNPKISSGQDVPAFLHSGSNANCHKATDSGLLLTVSKNYATLQQQQDQSIELPGYQTSSAAFLGQSQGAWPYSSYTESSHALEHVRQQTDVVFFV